MHPGKRRVDMQFIRNWDESEQICVRIAVYTEPEKYLSGTI